MSEKEFDGYRCVFWCYHLNEPFFLNDNKCPYCYTEFKHEKFCMNHRLICRIYKPRELRIVYPDGRPYK